MFVAHALATRCSRCADAARRMYDALQRQGTVGNDTLTQVGVWCIGEYGDLLVGAPVAPLDATATRVAEADVLALLESIAQRAITPTQATPKKPPSDADNSFVIAYAVDAGLVRAYITTALAKYACSVAAAARSRVAG